MDLTGLLGQWGQALQPLGNALGQVQQPIADNRNALMALGAGLMSGPAATAMPQAMENMMRGAVVDQRQRAAQMEALEKQRQYEMQVKQAQAAGLDPVWAGTSLPGAVMASRLKPQGGGREVSFTERQFNMLSPEEQAAYRRREFLGEGKPVQNQTELVRNHLAAKEQGYKGDLVQFAKDLKGKDQQTLTAGDKKAIQDADEAVTAGETAISNLEAAKALSPKSMYGPGASTRAWIGSLAGAPTAQNTAELENLAGVNALSQLKATFGAAPTEGERKVLMEIQGSVNQPPAIREKIFDRAIEMARKRLEFNKSKSQELRGGTYYTPGESAPAADPFAGVTIRQVR